MIKYINISLVIIILSSCMTLQPESLRVSSPDYNDRQIVSNPIYIKRPNIVAYVGTAATTIGGAYGMYKVAPIRQQNAEGNQKVDAANLAFGAIAGFAIGTAIQYISGKNKRIPIGDPQEWIKKADKNLKLYSFTNRDITVIPHNNSNKYSIHDLSDIKGYYRTFPQGLLKSNLYIESINIVKRSELPELITLETNKELTDKVKFSYFNRSETVDELVEAKNRYKGFSFELEPKGIQITKSYKDAIKMFNLVPNLKNKKSLYISSLSYPYTPNEAKDMLQKIGKENFILKEPDLKNTSSTQQRHTIENIFYTVEPEDMEYGYKILSKYNFLNFSTKKDFTMSFFWDKIYAKYTNGNRIIQEFTELGKKFSLKSIDLNQVDLNDFVINEMEEEARKNIIVIENDNISTKSDYIDSWKNSAYWDALLISSTGELKYLEYGILQNKSKFDLPVKVSASADLGSVTSYDFLNLVKAQEKAIFRGKSENEFYIPLLKSGEKQVFSILLDYGFRQQATGVNLLGLQAISELKLFNRKIELSYVPSSFTSAQIKKQNLWLDMLKSGMSKTKVIDPTNWSGAFEYIPQNYNMTWRKFVDQWKHNLAEAWSNTSSTSNSSNYDSQNAEKQEKMIEDCINQKDNELVPVDTQENLLVGKCNPCTIFRVPPKWILGSSSSYYLLQNEQNKWYYGHDLNLFDKGPYKTKREAILKNFCNNIKP